MVKNKPGSPEPQNRAVLLRRDGDFPLKFQGTQIGSYSRVYTGDPGTPNEGTTSEFSVRLFKTAEGEFVVGIESYDRTEGAYICRNAVEAGSLSELAGLLMDFGYFDEDRADIIVELFEKTELAAKLAPVFKVLKDFGYLDADMIVELFVRSEHLDADMIVKPFVRSDS
jgi:hypothetical protein